MAPRIALAVLFLLPPNEATSEASTGAGAGIVHGDVGDTIYSALEKYLGLKLVSRKGPVEMLVIDLLERTPTENLRARDLRPPHTANGRRRGRRMV